MKLVAYLIFTPSGAFTSAMWIEPPILREVTSTSTRTGIAVGSASTVMSCAETVRMPPAATPSARPVVTIGTCTFTGLSSSTSMKSAWRSWRVTGSAS